MKKIQSQIDNQEKMIQVLRDEIKQREREMKQAQSKMMLHITKLEKENLTLKKQKVVEPLTTSKFSVPKVTTKLVTTPQVVKQQTRNRGLHPQTTANSANVSFNGTIVVQKQQIMSRTTKTTQFNSTQSTTKSSVIELSMPSSI